MPDEVETLRREMTESLRKLEDRVRDLELQVSAIERETKQTSKAISEFARKSDPRNL